VRWRRAARAEPRRRSRATAQSSGPGSASERCRRAASSEDGATEAGNRGAFEWQRRRAAAASRRPPAYGGVGVVPLKPSSVMPPRPRRRRPNRLRVRVPLLSPPAKRLRTCGRRERDGQMTYIWFSTRCRCKMHHSLDYGVGRRFFLLDDARCVWVP